MDYEKKYNEALERAKMILCNISEGERCSDIETIFPELAESDDERRMSRIIDGFKNFSRSASKWNNIPIEEVIAYLEKQKENPKSAKDIEQAEDMDAVKKATLDLVECVEKYVRQETNRSTLIWKKEKLKRLLER